MRHVGYLRKIRVQYPNGLGGWGSFRDSITRPVKKVLGKKISSGLSTGINRYGLTALAAVATVVTGGAAAPALVAAASQATVDTVAAENAKKAKRAAKRQMRKLAGLPDVDDASLDMIPDESFPPGSLDAAVASWSLGEKIAAVAVPTVILAGIAYLVLRKKPRR